jgi:hypothetical protein
LQLCHNFRNFLFFSPMIIICNPTPVTELNGFSNSLIAEYLAYACPVLCIVSACTAFFKMKLSIKILFSYFINIHRCWFNNTCNNSSSSSYRHYCPFLHCVFCDRNEAIEQLDEVISLSILQYFILIKN